MSLELTTECDRMKAKDAQKLRDILAIAGIAVMLCGYIYKSLLIVGGVIACSCFIPHFLYNKCPRCGKQLGRNEGKHCQHCGKKFD